MEQFLSWFIPVLSIIVTGLTTLASWNLRISSQTLKKLTDTVAKLEIEVSKHSVRLDYIEKQVGDHHEIKE